MENFLNSTTPGDWIEALPNYQRSLVKEMLAGKEDYENVAIRLLQRTGSENTAPFGAGSAPENYFTAIRAEFRKFVCGDSRYEDLRKQALDLLRSGRTAIIGAIAGVIGATLGVAPAVIFPIIALLLAIATKIGVNAWCALDQ